MNDYSYSTDGEAKRRNDAGGADVLSSDLRNPYAEGSARYVARGTYNSGRRQGQQCVVKWGKSGHVTHGGIFQDAMRPIHKALEIVDRFNREAVISSHVVLNVPDIWEFGYEAGAPLAGKKVLIEPFIDDFTKWNSNTGWVDLSAAWARAMQALSHFSYHDSNGQLVLCDLQGGFYEHAAVLTDPVICSRSWGYGFTDLGQDGIDAFFASHQCTEYCRDGWRRPPHRKAPFEPRQGTTMRNAVGGYRI